MIARTSCYEPPLVPGNLEKVRAGNAPTSAALHTKLGFRGGGGGGAGGALCGIVICRHSHILKDRLRPTLPTTAAAELDVPVLSKDQLLENNHSNHGRRRSATGVTHKKRKAKVEHRNDTQGSVETEINRSQVRS